MHGITTSHWLAVQQQRGSRLAPRHHLRMNAMCRLATHSCNMNKQPNNQQQQKVLTQQRGRGRRAPARLVCAGAGGDGGCWPTRVTQPARMCTHILAGSQSKAAFCTKRSFDARSAPLPSSRSWAAVTPHNSRSTTTHQASPRIRPARPRRCSALHEHAAWQCCCCCYCRACCRRCCCSCLPPTGASAAPWRTGAAEGPPGGTRAGERRAGQDRSLRRHTEAGRGRPPHCCRLAGAVQHAALPSQSP
jgi:hypothetical protein